MPDVTKGVAASAPALALPITRSSKGEEERELVRLAQNGTEAAYEELVRRFGPPSMEVTTRPGRRTLSYAAREGTVAVDVENDKVVSAATAEARQNAVVLLQ